MNIKHLWKRRWARRTVYTLGAACLLLLVGNIAYVAADTGSGSLGQTPATLAWIDVADQRGINLWQYELAINFDSGIFNPMTQVSAMFTSYVWQGYLGLVAIAIWFLDWVIAFDWLQIIITPITAIGDALRGIMSRLGLTSAFLSVTALVGALFIMRGKIARGIYEMLVGALVVAVSTTVLSNPVALVAGPGGWIYQARDYTLEIVAEMGGGTASTGTQALTGELITTFVRQPVQMVSFGEVLDGTSCESVYDGAVKSGPHGYADSTIRDAIAACNSNAGKFAETPGANTVTSVVMLSPGALVVLLVAALIAGTIMLALVATVLAALKAIINVVFAVLPGGARRPLAHNIAEVFVGLVMFVGSMFFLALYLQVIQAIFSAEGNPAKAFAVVTIAMIIGLVLFLRYRKAWKASTERLTNWMAKPPGGSAPRALVSPASGAVKAATLYGAAKVLTSPAAAAAAKYAASAGAAALGAPVGLVAAGLSGAAKRFQSRKGTVPTAAPSASPARQSTPAASQPVLNPSRPRAALPPGPDGEVLEGAVLEPGQGPQPRLPMRRMAVAALPAAPPRPATRRPLPLPPGPTRPPGPRPRPSTPAGGSGPAGKPSPSGPRVEAKSPAKRPAVVQRPEPTSAQVQNQPPPRTTPAPATGPRRQVPPALRRRNPTQREIRR